MNTIFIYILAA